MLIRIQSKLLSNIAFQIIEQSELILRFLTGCSQMLDFSQRIFRGRPPFRTIVDQGIFLSGRVDALDVLFIFRFIFRGKCIRIVSG